MFEQMKAVHRKFIVIILMFVSVQAIAQTAKKIVPARRATATIKVDGLLNDPAWSSAARADDFLEQRPRFGAPVPEHARTEMYIMYDDNAVYIAGFNHETSRDSISTELVGRDRVGINDFAGVMFDTYKDEINGVGFYVTALGEQFDTKYSLGYEDGSWSTVYQAATNITDSGWSYEMAIPYSALRFSKEKVQNWGINFVRRRVKSGQQFSWSPLDPNKFGTMNQAGIWQGIENIKSPIRLSFSPYFSTYLTGEPVKGEKKDWSTSVNGGMDVKYGISKAFTLDMTLIPDFGQVQSDNQVLNLSPFEVRYNENRSFFTEGTELFNKGGLFYSRRIGGTPLHYRLPYSVGSAAVVKNPSETKLINATKISGRTAGGLGVGFFNAITRPQYAELETPAKERYKLETNPTTNYNIFVLDQTMKNNSSVSLINTNVLRNGSDYDANVTAGLWDLYDNKVNWNFWGKVANSRLLGYKAPGETVSGYNYELNMGKFKGPFNFDLHQYVADDKYNPSDMGYFTNNNFYNWGLNAWYKINKPKAFYNNLFFSTNSTWSQRFKPRSYQYVNVNMNANSQLKNLWNIGVNFFFTAEAKDFYEPRIRDMVFQNPGWWRAGFRVNTNTAKKLSLFVSANNRSSSEYHTNGLDFTINPSFRFSDKLTVSFNSYNESVKNSLGFATVKRDTVTFKDTSVFGLRNRITSDNIFTIKYNFNTKMGITFRARHYWSEVDYKQFFNLQTDGTMGNRSTPTGNQNFNQNYFNIDMVYTWEFAQGSFINVGWKNIGSRGDQIVDQDYFHNLTTILNDPQQNIFSVKVIYYLDYLTLKKKK
jgi:hypothetical protein